MARVSADVRFDLLVENLFKLRFQYTTAGGNNTEIHMRLCNI